MANLIIQENGVARTRPAVMGEEITIKTPCDCSYVTGVQINGVVFPFYDATGHSLSSIDGLFAQDSLIRVMIDVDSKRAYILNADTNAYIDSRLGYDIKLDRPVTTGCGIASGGYETLQPAIPLVNGDMYWIDCRYTYNDGTVGYSKMVSRVVRGIVHWNGTEITYDGAKLSFYNSDADSIDVFSVAKVLLFEKKNAPFADLEGSNNLASGCDAHAEGYETQATNWNAHAEGRSTIASGTSSHAEGHQSVASGTGSHAEGYHTEASGTHGSHAEGRETKATGASSHAEGYKTRASSDNQHVQGRYNVEDAEGEYAHIVGNGDSENNRSNAHTIDWQGNAWFQGDVYTGGTDWDTGSRKLAVTFLRTVTIYADSSKWARGEDGYYSQEIEVDDIISSDTPIVDIKTGTSNAANEVYQEEFSKVVRIATDDGKITVYARAMTDANVTIQLKVVR